MPLLLLIRVNTYTVLENILDAKRWNIDLNLAQTTALWGKYYYAYFTDREIGTQNKRN